MSRDVVLTAALLVAGAAWIHAQPAAATPGSTAALTSTPAPGSPPTPASDYLYAAAGRRDPFVPAVGEVLGGAMLQPVIRPAGVRGLMTAEVVVRGILESQGIWLAIIRATNGRTYSLRVGDRLLDGTVRVITADAMVILQDGHDSSAPNTARDVRKVLRGGEGTQ